MSETTDAKAQVLETYFESLDDADFERAADQFTEDVTYIHPPMYGDETHIRGRDSLRAFFTDVRGPQENGHRVERTLESGDAAAVVGSVTDPDDGEPLERFVAYAEFVDGRIDYYIAGLLGMS